SKIFSLSQGATWDKQLIQIGDRLKNEGLQEEAIAQYEKFLEGPKIDPSLRAKVSHSIGRLYQEKGNCRQALVWFFQVELAHPQTAREKNLGAQIDFCLQQIKSSAGDELN
ncbi:MAG: hypothetical protein VYC17_02985, partial [Nitrospinota bacterium]|nr:hypothetical protein [Nitrospinota bacterium]